MTDGLQPVVTSAWPKARPQDVASIESLMRAFDDCLSFDAGELGRQLDRMRSLFLPTANVVSPVPWRLATDAKGFVQFYLSAMRDMGADATGFGERNKIMRTLSIGNVHSVYTHYTLHMPRDNPESAEGGINLFHIVQLDGRYWIASCVWEDESETAVTPPDLKPDEADYRTARER